MNRKDILIMKIDRSTVPSIEEFTKEQEELLNSGTEILINRDTHRKYLNLPLWFQEINGQKGKYVIHFPDKLPKELEYAINAHIEDSINPNTDEYQKLHNYLSDQGFIPLESDIKHIVKLSKAIIDKIRI